MIQEFSLNNFLSFGDKQTVSFLASSDKAHIKELTFEPKKGVKILRFLMVYGANASGKSNLLAAIWNLWEMLIYPTSNESEKIRFYKPFELKKGAPVEFEIVFWKEHTKFEYIIKFNESEILYEKMQYTTAAGILSDLYERVQGEEIKFGSTLQMKVKEKNDFNIETLKNHTVLSTLNKKKY
jgi:AAA15 family ATPase/GTPase